MILQCPLQLGPAGSFGYPRRARRNLLTM